MQVEAGESGGLHGTDGKWRGTSHAILSNQSHRGDRSSFQTRKPTAGATEPCGKRRGQEIRWKAQRLRLKGSLGQERWVFFQDTTMSRAQLPSSFLPGIPPDYQYQTGRNLSYSQLFLSNVIICSLMQIPLIFSCVFFSSNQLDIRRLTSLLPLNFYIWNNVDGPKE